VAQKLSFAGEARWYLAAGPSIVMRYNPAHVNHSRFFELSEIALFIAFVVSQ
jgi:hypothetical protein